MAMVDLSMQKAMYMKELGKMTKPMVSAIIRITMAAGMRVNGWQTNSMEKELRNGQMEPNTKDSMKMERNMVRDVLHLLTVALTQALSAIMRYPE